MGFRDRDSGLWNQPDKVSAHTLDQVADMPAVAVLASWQQVGAVCGWIAIDALGQQRFQRERPASGSLPAFRFNQFPTGAVNTLPAPDVPFGLWLGTSTKDADLQELAGLKQLQALHIEGNFAFGPGGTP
jgi:hypothetical protein